MKRGVAVVLAMLMLAGCGGSSLEDEDPRGFEACQQLIKARSEDEDPAVRLNGILAAGEAAAEAETEAIRDAAGEPLEGLEDHRVADGERLEVACEDVGVNIPAAE